MSEAAQALAEVAMRRRLLTRDRALALSEALADCGDSDALRDGLAHQPAQEALVLQELLPNGLPETGAWRPLACLGQGRTASAWLALGPDARWGVLKLYHATRLKPGPDVELFLRDVTPLVGGERHYLVPYLAAFAAGDGRAALVQEYVPGRDLAARGQTKGALQEARALPMLRQAAKGLAELERLGTVHGMLHPGNVLLDSEGRARLTDYGLAFGRTLQAPRPGWEPRALMLHAWSAPEALATPPQLLLAGDVYALGCVAFLVLGGQPPFPGTPDQQALQQASGPRPDVRAHVDSVSEISAKTILKAMQVEPAQRYRGGVDFAASLQRNLERLTGQPVKSGPQRTLPTNPTVAPGIAAALEPPGAPVARPVAGAPPVAKPVQPRPELDLED